MGSESQSSSGGSRIMPVAIAWKRLVAVEALQGLSVQHELNGSKPLEDVLGPPVGKTRFKTQFLHLSDDAAPLAAEGECTWYDARERHPTRSELRLYFRTNPVTESMREGDLLLLFLRKDRSLAFVVCDAGSNVDAEIRGLLNLSDTSDSRMFGLSKAELDAIAVRPRFKALAVELGLCDNDVSSAVVAKALALNNGSFPTTEQMAQLAADSTILPAGADADTTLELRMAQEEAIFLKIEELLIEPQLAGGFRGVQHFVGLAMSVVNRRKSRAGAALQHHVHAVLKAAGLQVTAQGTTEGKYRPDFLLPGESEYHDPNFSAKRLTMLAVKRTCKDRWPQVLTEAARIEYKHLLTLEPGISEHQLTAMSKEKVILVVPRGIQDTYPSHLRSRLMTVEGLIADVKRRSNS